MIPAGPTSSMTPIWMNRVTINTIYQTDDPPKTQDSSLHHYYRLVRDAFERARPAQRMELEHNYQICGYPIRLNFATAALVPKITSALEHLSVQDRPEPALTIYIWDSASTGVKLPIPPWETDPNLGDMWVGDTIRYQFSYRPEFGILSFLDKSTNQAIYWTRGVSDYPYYESGAPLRYLLNWWMGDRGFQLVHAGAVGTEDGCVLLVGKGGVGKSTSAFTCLNSGLSYAGDDYCMISQNPQPNAHSIYSSGKLNAEDIDRFPEFRPALSNIDRLENEKALYFFAKHYPQRISKGFPVRAILIPELSDRRKANITRVSPAASFMALAPSTIFQLRGIKQPIHKNIAAFVRRVPSYKLALGTDMASIPGVISDFLAEFDDGRTTSR